DLVEGPGLEVGCSHRGLERAEGVLDGGSADAHGVGPPVQPLLHGVDHGLMFPALDPALTAARALLLERTVGAPGGPVGVQRLAVLDRAEAARQPLAGRTAIDVSIGQVDEVLLAEASLGLGA